MNYNEALNLIIKKQSLGIMPGLERMRKMLESFDNPQDDVKIIHIAGTNGKGTVAAAIADALISCGFKTGLFTSPWLEDYREQIKIDGEMISEKSFAYYVDKFKDFDSTEFELLCAVMFKYFSDSNVDYAVIECGMGALEDATNTERENVSVITSVSVDHTDFLGDTVEEIARQKAGIIRKNSTCFLYPNPECEAVFEAECAKNNTKLIKTRDFGNIFINDEALAQSVIDFLGLDFKVKIKKLPARQSVINGVLIDGGHNIGAAKALCGIIDNEVAVIGMMADKNVDGYMSLVAPKCKKIFTVTVDNPRSMKANELYNIAKKYCNDVVICDNPSKAVRLAMSEKLSLVCGSFYLYRQIRKEFF